jgi:hypothetical protein
MALTNVQVRQLRAKLEPKHVKTRKANGTSLYYVEGWHVIAEANRIFGYDAWDRRTLASRCVWSGPSGPYHAAAYTAKVRVSVRAGDIVIVREGSGTGEGAAPTPGQAHELALKSAETDATKRALATFGNPFGLALYDREQAGVRKIGNGHGTAFKDFDREPLMLRSATGTPGATFQEAKDFVEALHKAMSAAQDIELLYAIWEQNLETVRTLHRRHKDESSATPKLIRHLRDCAIGLVKRANDGAWNAIHPGAPKNLPDHNATSKIDKSVLTISEPKRIRSKEHLRFVALQPCLICGRAPAQAHHIRFAQAKGLGLKVSDEFTVPLCAIHHNQNHATGDERTWWGQHKTDPLEAARELWLRSQSRSIDAPKQPQREVSEPR